MCVTFVVFTDCESCTRPISTNPGSKEAGECGRTLGTCFITCRLEAVVVAGRLWLSWCAFGGADFFAFFFFKQKTAYEIGVRLVGSEMCIRDRSYIGRKS